MEATKLRYGVLAVLLVAATVGFDVHAQNESTRKDTREAAGSAPSEPSLEEIDRQLNNPLTSLWSLTLQNNTSINNGDRVDGDETANVLFFQPALPIPVGKNKDKIFIARPVIPLVTNPVFETAGLGFAKKRWISSQFPLPARRYLSGLNGLESDGHETGLGDIQILALVGPARTDGWLWGVGPTLIFPTATDDALGQDKFQAGPAAMVYYMGKPWVGGFLAQHWWSYAGDSDRPDTNKTDFQYIIRRSFPGAWSVGMGPTISIDWEADSDDRWTVPVGLGVTKTVRWGKAPVKLRAEVHYFVIQPDSYGTEWNIRFQVTPVIKSPFAPR